MKLKQVTPAAGIIEADNIAEISICHEEFQTKEEFVDGVPQNFWCEDTRDKEAILLVKVRGNCTTETKCHRIRVRYSITGKLTPMNKKTNNPNPIQPNLLHRSNFRFSDSCDVVGHLEHLHTP